MLGGRRVVVILFSLFVLLLSANVYAQYGQYGQGPSKTIDIEKFVAEKIAAEGGTSEEFVENLSSSDPRFRPSENVRFKLTVKNTSDVELKNVQVIDFLPDFFEPVEGPGTFDSNTRKLTFSAGDFKVGEEKTYFLTVRVLSQDKLPSDKGVMCVVNKAEASTEGVSDTDSSQLCIEKEVPPVKEVPAAGPEAGMALLGFNLLGVSVGYWLRRKK